LGLPGDGGGEHGKQVRKKNPFLTAPACPQGAGFDLFPPETAGSFFKISIKKAYYINQSKWHNLCYP
jgi:hypothetical protein